MGGILARLPRKIVRLFTVSPRPISSMIYEQPRINSPANAPQNSPQATLTNSTTHKNPITIIHRLFHLTGQLEPLSQSILYNPRPIIKIIPPIQVLSPSPHQCTRCQTPYTDRIYFDPKYYRTRYYHPQRSTCWNARIRS